MTNSLAPLARLQTHRENLRTLLEALDAEHPECGLAPAEYARRLGEAAIEVPGILVELRKQRTEEWREK